jgi:hypothetical protein
MRTLDSAESQSDAQHLMAREVHPSDKAEQSHINDPLSRFINSSVHELVHPFMRALPS